LARTINEYPCTELLPKLLKAMSEISSGTADLEGLTQLLVVADSMSLDTYSEFLKVPGLLNVQLKAPGATAEELRQYPARLSKEGKIYIRTILRIHE
jgi:hypothetical protein